MAAPTRITIELEPPRNGRDRWRARTRVEGDLPSPSVAASIPPVVATVPNDVEHGEPTVVPTPYEASGECTCVEGWCDADHEHE